MRRSRLAFGETTNLVTLTPEVDEIIRRKFESGQYRDASELLSEAVLQREARDQQLDQLRAAWQVGIDQSDNGELIPWTHDSMNEIQREAEEADRLGIPVPDFHTAR